MFARMFSISSVSSQPVFVSSCSLTWFLCDHRAPRLGVPTMMTCSTVAASLHALACGRLRGAPWHRRGDDRPLVVDVDHDAVLVDVLGIAVGGDHDRRLLLRLL